MTTRDAETADGAPSSALGVQPSAFSLLEQWFARRGWQPFAFQREAWDAYLAGESGLIHASTGTGKTYAAWLGPLIEFIIENAELRKGNALQSAPVANPQRRNASSNASSAAFSILNSQFSIPAPQGLRVLWLTPLRALAADTEAALRAPLDELGLPWTLESRTGDTPTALRARQGKRLPTALVTTPESLSLLLARDDAPQLFANLRAVIVDEWHELLATKRGVQVELALARLRHFRPALRTWGLSATLGNLEVAANALLGSATDKETRDTRHETPYSDSSGLASPPLASPPLLVRGLAPKTIVIDALLPATMERFPWAGHLGLRMLPQVAAAIDDAASALVFTNTRAQTEQWYGALLEARPDWAGIIALHHGSLDRAQREWVERGLRTGALKCVVCTSSLDLGVDFAPVDRVFQIGSPKGMARLIQRAGRSGHGPGRTSRVTCVPTNAFELIEIAAAREAVAAGEIEARVPLDHPLDVLVQHIVTVALGGGFTPDELLAEVRTTYAYRNLADDEWQWALDFATRGGPALRAYPEYQRVAQRDGRYVVDDKAIARRHRLSIGTIVSEASVRVQYLRGAALGTVEESFIARLKPGDRFTFAGKTLEFVRVRDMTAWVRRASGKEAVVPRWSGSRQPISTELAAAVRAKLDEARQGVFDDPELEAVRPILALQAKWSKLPEADELLAERVKTREGYHLFVYPFEGRLAHEGMAALLAYRIGRLMPISFTLAANDYGFELLSPTPATLGEGLETLLSPEALLEDIPASLNAAELARRQFREIARVAGLVFQGYPGSGKSARQLQASSGLLYDVFSQYDPDNLLLVQARREVIERQLEHTRILGALRRIAAGRVTLLDVKRPTPLAFPLLVDRLREAVSSEQLADRVRRMLGPLERVADSEG